MTIDKFFTKPNTRAPSIYDLGKSPSKQQEFESQLKQLNELAKSKDEEVAKVIKRNKEIE